MRLPLTVALVVTVFVSPLRAQRGLQGFAGPPGYRGPPGQAQPRYVKPGDVTVVTVNDTAVGLCTHKHLCARLGCQPHNGRYVPLCFCDSDCRHFDDCCIDYKETCLAKDGSHRQSEEQNTPKSELSSLSCVTPTDQSSSYYLVSSCPEGYPDNQTAVQCEEPDETDALATVPCYGNRTRAHYRNYKCALCRGEQLADLTAWAVTVRCVTRPELRPDAYYLLRESLANLDRVRSELGCIVAMEPPESVPVLPRACYPRSLRRCPSAGHALYGACESYTAVTAADGRYAGRLYRNPHCALCNNPHVPQQRVDFATDCGPPYDFPVVYVQVPEDDDFITAPLGGGQPGPRPRPVPPPPVSVLFDFRSRSRVRITLDREVEATETVDCPAGRVFDPFSARCRQLACSDGYLLRGDRCLPDLESLGGACGDEDGVEGQGVTATMTVAFPEVGDDRLNSSSSSNGTHEFLDGLRSCLADFLGQEPESLQLTNSSTDFSSSPLRTELSFDLNTTLDSFADIDDVLGLPLADLPQCQVLDSLGDWQVGFSQSCRRFQSVDSDDESCLGRWLNDTEFNLGSVNGTTVLRVNDSGHVYALRATVLRANYRRRGASIHRYADARVCAHPTLACPRVSLNASLFSRHPDHQGSLVYDPDNSVFAEGEYVRTDGEIQVCSFLERNGTKNGTSSAFFFQFSAPQQILSLVGTLASMAAEVATLLTYFLFRELRKRVSVAIMAMVGCLFAAQLLLLLAGVAVANLSACVAIALLGHFFWLASVLWTAVLAFDLHRVFGATDRVRRLEADRSVLARQCVLPLGGAGAIVLLTLALDLTGHPPSLSYGSEAVCWLEDGVANLLAFGLPVAATMVANAVLFGLTVRGISKTRSKTKGVQKPDKSTLDRTKENLIIYVKISSLMGFTWIFGFAAAFSDAVALWYLFIILNSAQGVFIFLSFVCNRKVGRLWLDLLCRHRGGGAGGGTSGDTTKTPSGRALAKLRRDGGPDQSPTPSTSRV